MRDLFSDEVAARLAGGLIERPIHDIRNSSRYDVHQQQVRSVTHPAVTRGWRTESESRLVVVEVRARQENRGHHGAPHPTAVGKSRRIAECRTAQARSPAPLAQIVMRRTMAPTRWPGPRRGSG